MLDRGSHLSEEGQARVVRCAHELMGMLDMPDETRLRMDWEAPQEASTDHARMAKAARREEPTQPSATARSDGGMEVCVGLAGDAELTEDGDHPGPQAPGASPPR